MKLSQMQDLGGCRAVLGNVSEVRDVVALYGKSSIKHKLVDLDDYVENPRHSGYRGIHLIYRYFSDRSTTYNGLRIEIQLRSPLQHAWATAVETVGTFTRQALKSSQGEEDWLRFFSLMGSAIARREKCPLVPDTPSQPAALVKEIKKYVRDLDVDNRLKVYGRAVQLHEEHVVPRAHYYLLELDVAPGGGTISVTGYERRHLDAAEKQYAEREQAIRSLPGADVVLVSTESLDSLKRAYPNYFLDTDAFRAAVRRVASA